MQPAAISQPATSSHRFERVLSAAAGQGRKSERTQLGFQAAACRLLERTAPSDIKVADICREAGTAHGTFYIYFRDIRHLLSDTLTGFVSYLKSEMLQASRAGGGDSIRSTTAAYVSLFDQNAGLMRCLVSRMDSFPEATAAFESLNRDWAETVTDARMRRASRDPGASPPQREELLRRAYALGGMVDQYLIMLLFGGDRSLADVSRDRAAVIETLSLIWERGMQP